MLLLLCFRAFRGGKRCRAGKNALVRSYQPAHSGTQGTKDRVRIFNESRSSAQGLVAHHLDFSPFLLTANSDSSSYNWLYRSRPANTKANLHWLALTEELGSGQAADLIFFLRIIGIVF
jgi:hypothetical protein